jgi:hypothetical protein
VKIRRKSGVIRIDAHAAEVALLASLLDDLSSLLSVAEEELNAEHEAAGEAGGEPLDDRTGEPAARPAPGALTDDPALARLFPDGYTDDDRASAEFRELVAADLLSERTSRLAACRAELPLGGGRFTLDDEAADRWIRVLNDLRLTIGVRIGVTEDDDLDPRAESTTLYRWLSVVQELLVDELIG